MVCFVLGSGAMLFSKLTTDLVITPIENMIKNDAIKKKKGNDDNFTEVAAPEGLFNRKSL